MKKYSFLLLSTLILCFTLQNKNLHADMNIDTYGLSGQFESVLGKMGDVIAEKIPGSYGQIFFNGIDSACNIFDDLVRFYNNNSFKVYPGTKKRFEQLCEIVQVIDASQEIKRHHIRALSKKINNLNKTTIFLNKNETGLIIAKQIASLTTLMKNDIFSYLLEYVDGSLTDFLIRQPYEWVKQNWWWAIPATIGGVKFIKDARRFAQERAVDPADWNLEEDSKPNLSLYKTLGLAATALVTLPFAIGDGLIGNKYGQPIGQRAGAREEDVTWEQYQMIRVETERENQEPLVEYHRERIGDRAVHREYRPRRITQLPCLRQVGVDCGYHALYNVYCLQVNQIEQLLNREDFDAYITEARTILRNAGRRVGFINADDINTLITEINLFAPIRNPEGEGGGDNLADNISMLFDTHGLEEIFHDPNFHEEILRTHEGGYRHTIANIYNFRDTGETQYIIVNIGGQDEHGNGRGVHWVAMMLNYNEATETDEITILDSTGTNYLDHPIINTIYRFFRTDPIPELPELVLD